MTPHQDVAIIPPVDFGRKLTGIRIFGDHKTFRGIISGLIVGALIFKTQLLLYRSASTIREISLLDYTNIHTLIWGGLIGLGALAGDLIKSFAKRRVGILLGLILHLLVKWIGYLIHVNATRI